MLLLLLFPLLLQRHRFCFTTRWRHRASEQRTSWFSSSCLFMIYTAVISEFIITMTTQQIPVWFWFLGLLRVPIEGGLTFCFLLPSSFILLLLDTCWLHPFSKHSWLKHKESAGGFHGDADSALIHHFTSLHPTGSSVRSSSWYTMLLTPNSLCKIFRTLLPLPDFCRNTWENILLFLRAEFSAIITPVSVPGTETPSCFRRSGGEAGGQQGRKERLQNVSY